MLANYIIALNGVIAQLLSLWIQDRWILDSKYYVFIIISSFISICPHFITNFAEHA